MKWSNKDTLVTGGAGFIGSHLVDTLLERKARVTVVDNMQRGTPQNLQHCIDRIKLIDFDLTKGYPEIGYEFHYIFDLASRVYGITNLYERPASMLWNPVIAMNVMENNLTAKYIYLSSSCVYDYKGASFPHKEDQFGWLNSEYGWSKKYAEMACKAHRKEHGLNYCIARPFNVYGPRESMNFPHVIPDFIKQAIACERGKLTFDILGSGKQTRSFTYVDDAVEGLRYIAERGHTGEAYNICTDRETGILTLAKMILKTFKLRNVPINTLKAIKGDVQRRRGSNKKLKALGWEAQTTLEQGLNITIDWYREEINK